jgi:hypothetical protein
LAIRPEHEQAEPWLPVGGVLEHPVEDPDRLLARPEEDACEPPARRGVRKCELELQARENVGVFAALGQSNVSGLLW